MLSADADQATHLLAASAREFLTKPLDVADCWRWSTGCARQAPPSQHGVGYTPGDMDSDATAARKNYYKQVIGAHVLAGVILGVVPGHDGSHHPPQACALTAAVLLQARDDLHDLAEPRPVQALVPAESTAATGSYREEPPAEPAEATLAITRDETTGRLRAAWVVEGSTVWPGQPADHMGPDRQELTWAARRVDNRRRPIAARGTNDYRSVVVARRWWPPGRGQGRGA